MRKQQADSDPVLVAPDDRFPDDDYLQQTVEVLAMYRPNGGDLLFDTAAITKRLIETKAYLQKENWDTLRRP